MQPKNFQILKISKQTSRYTGKPVYAVFFKGDDGKSYKSWVDPNNGNFKRWENLLKVKNILTGLNIKGNGNLIDADSYPKLVTVKEQETVKGVELEQKSTEPEQNALFDTDNLVKKEERQYF